VSGGEDEEVREPADDAVDQLERLAELREQGVLSEDEYAAAKRRILDGS
jgi:Short C-terminal domain